MKKKILALLLGVLFLFGAMPVSAGWEQCWRYTENGAPVRNEWRQLDGEWFYFNGDGIMHTGWVSSGGKWYWCGEDGKMATGWIELADGTYYLTESGAMVTGTQVIDGKEYRFSDSGRLIDFKATDWNMILVNPTYALPENFTIKTASFGGQKFDSRIIEPLKAMFADAKAAGYPLLMTSGYRTVNYQQGLFDRSVRDRINRGMTPEAALAETYLYVAKAGHSEHNLGLAADIVSSNWYSRNTGLVASFDQTPHFAWLSENAWKYGFILRYTKGDTHITGYAYEPWHYRYVGVEAAKIIRDEGITFEEFHEKYLSK